MPWPTYESLPKAVKTMLKNLGAGKGSKLERQWRHVANSCLKRGGKEVSCIKQANSVVKKAAKGDSSMDIEWTDLPESARKAIKDVGGSSMSKEFDFWVSDYTFCRERGGTDEKCKAYATAWMESRKTLHLPMPDGSKMKITDDMVLYHEPITFNAEEGEVVQDSVTGKDVYRVPITATRQGVMNSRFKPWNELENSFWTLEHKPIIAPSHPPDGEPVTSRVFDNIVGFISDVHLNEDDTSVRAFHNYFMDHAWVVANLDKIGKEQQATSVGYYAITERLETDQTYNGVSYNLVDRFMYFDHNAHLVNIPAACPVPSCGIMVNEEGYNMTEEENQENIPEESTALTSGISDSANTTWNFDIDTPTVWVPPIDSGTVTVTWTSSGSNSEPEEYIPQTHEEIEAREDIFDTGIYDSLGEITKAEIAAYIIDACCEDIGDKEYVEGDQKFTFSPPWSQVDKSKLPRSAFAIKGEADKKSTWKFPYKNPGGAVNCNGVRAARAALGGARTPAKISSSDRARLKKLFDRLWTSCQKMRGQDMEQGLEEKQLNTHKIIKESDNMTEEETLEVTDKAPKEDSVKDPVPLRATAGSIEARVMEAENRKLSSQVQSLQDRISELEGIEKQRKDAEVSRLREIAVELNADFEAFSDEEISEMDEKTLGTAIKALQVKAHPSARAVFGNTKKDTSPYRSSEFAPLTVFAEKKEDE